jgi:glycosyltransferase involved in cell wall biosynthesis
MKSNSSFEQKKERGNVKETDNSFTDHLLTVLIPNYNYGDYIGEAIDSIFAQDYPSIELIIVDDGSTDNSVAEIQTNIKENNKISRCELMVLEQNRGKLGAINATQDLLRGEFLITLDADDWLSPGYASRCIAELRQKRLRDPNLGFIYSDCELVDEHGKHIDYGRSTTFKRSLVEKLSFLPEPALMLTRAFKQVMPFDETIRVATKHHKWCRIVNNDWSGYHIAEPLFYYRMHSNNISGIGKRITSETEKGEYGERILSGFWGTAKGGAAHIRSSH